MVLYLPRDAVSVPVSRQVLDSCLETLGVTPDTRADIVLALSEACANVIQHAGPGEEYEVQGRALALVARQLQVVGHRVDDLQATAMLRDRGQGVVGEGEPV